MNLLEEALLWDCKGLNQIGVLASPSDEMSPWGVLFVVGGPQTRAGSHRLHVQTARSLAEAGYASLRFDARGMGDSEGQPGGFEQMSDDIDAALTQLQRARPRLKRFLLWGLCDAASAALLYLHERVDPRVGALILLNPWVRSDESEARARFGHYYRERLLQASFWRKLLRGEVGWSAAVSSWHRLRRINRQGFEPSNEHFSTRMARAWANFGGSTLVILSGNDLTAQEFRLMRRTSGIWQSIGSRGAPIEEHTLDDATHTFSEQGMTQRM